MYVNTWCLSTNLFNRPTTQFNKEIVQHTRQGHGALESDCLGSYPLSPPVVLGQLIKISGSWFIYLKTEIIIAPTLQDCMRLNDLPIICLLSLTPNLLSCSLALRRESANYIFQTPLPVDISLFYQ